MHIALIVDAERLHREHAMLGRLTVGLIGEGDRVTRIVPAGMAQSEIEAIERAERKVALAPRIETPMPAWSPLAASMNRLFRWGALRRSRSQKLAVVLERALPDVIYAFGEHSWPVALELGTALEKPVALQVNGMRVVRRVPRVHGALGGMARHVAAYIAPTQPIADALKQRVDADLVSVVPLGVAVPDNSDRSPIFEQPGRSISAAIIGANDYGDRAKTLAASRAMLAGLNIVAADFPQLHAAMELRGRTAAAQHDLWRAVVRLGLADRISPFTEASQHRSLLTQCDLLIVPVNIGEPTSLLLECMAAGMAVVALSDPALDMLVHDQTAMIVDRSDQELWATAIGMLLRDHERARALGNSAHSHIATHHRSTNQISTLASTLHRIVKGETYPFLRTPSRTP